MTLYVTQDGQTVTIHGNTGLNARIEGSRVQGFTVSEHFMHLRHFWGQLGHALDEAETEAVKTVKEA